MSALSLTARALSDPVITTIIVGPEKDKFSVHKALLFQHLNYFRAAYHAEKQEGHQNQFTFNDIDSKIFKVFVRWMYTSEIYIVEDAEEPLKLEFCDDKDYDDAQDGSDTDSESGEESESEKEEDGEQKNILHNEIYGPPKPETMSPEQLIFHSVFGHCYESFHELDEYQLEVLLELEYPDEVLEILRPKLETNLHAMRQHQSEVLTLLFDLFILADRVDVKALRARVMDHLQAERSRRFDGLDNDIPAELVHKAFNNLPEYFALCRWLVYVFARDWELETDVTRRMTARNSLPTQLLLEILIGSRLHP